MPKMGWTQGRFAPGVTDTSDDLAAVAYGSGKGFVAVGHGPSASFASTNGIQWIESTAGLDSAGPLYGVTHYNGDYVAVDSDGGIASSPSGSTWTPRAATGVSLSSIGAYGGEFVAVGDNGAIYIAPSAVPPTQWTFVNSGTTENLLAVAGGSTLWEFIAVGASGTILASKNLGTSWTPQTSGTLSHLDGLIYGNGRYVAVGEARMILTSTNGTFWAPASTNYNYTGTDLYAVGYGNGLFVAVGEDGWTAVSRDGSAWAWSTSETVNTLRGITYSNGAFAAVGDSGTLMLSVAPKLGPVTLLPNRSFQISVAGGPGQQIQIQASTDLLNWLVVTTVKLDLNGAGQFTDAATPHRFFRAITQ